MLEDKSTNALLECDNYFDSLRSSIEIGPWDHREGQDVSSYSHLRGKEGPFSITKAEDKSSQKTIKKEKSSIKLRKNKQLEKQQNALSSCSTYNKLPSEEGTFQEIIRRAVSQENRESQRKKLISKEENEQSIQVAEKQKQKKNLLNVYQQNLLKNEGEEEQTNKKKEFNSQKNSAIKLQNYKSEGEEDQTIKKEFNSQKSSQVKQQTFKNEGDAEQMALREFISRKNSAIKFQEQVLHLSNATIELQVDNSQKPSKEYFLESKKDLREDYYEGSQNSQNSCKQTSLVQTTLQLQQMKTLRHNQSPSDSPFFIKEKTQKKGNYVNGNDQIKLADSKRLDTFKQKILFKCLSHSTQKPLLSFVLRNSKHSPPPAQKRQNSSLSYQYQLSPQLSQEYLNENQQHESGSQLSLISPNPLLKDQQHLQYLNRLQDQQLDIKQKNLAKQQPYQSIQLEEASKGRVASVHSDLQYTSQSTNNSCIFLTKNSSCSFQEKEQCPSENKIVEEEETKRNFKSKSQHLSSSIKQKIETLLQEQIDSKFKRCKISKEVEQSPNKEGEREIVLKAFQHKSSIEERMKETNGNLLSSQNHQISQSPIADEALVYFRRQIADSKGKSRNSSLNKKAFSSDSKSKHTQFQSTYITQDELNDYPKYKNNIEKLSNCSLRSGYSSNLLRLSNNNSQLVQQSDQQSQLGSSFTMGSNQNRLSQRQVEVMENQKQVNSHSKTENSNNPSRPKSVWKFKGGNIAFKYLIQNENHLPYSKDLQLKRGNNNENTPLEMNQGNSYSVNPQHNFKIVKNSTEGGSSHFSQDGLCRQTLEDTPQGNQRALRLKQSLSQSKYHHNNHLYHKKLLGEYELFKQTLVKATEFKQYASRYDSYSQQIINEERGSKSPRKTEKAFFEQQQNHQQQQSQLVNQERQQQQSLDTNSQQKGILKQLLENQNQSQPLALSTFDQENNLIGDKVIILPFNKLRNQSRESGQQHDQQQGIQQERNLSSENKQFKLHDNLKTLKESNESSKEIKGDGLQNVKRSEFKMDILPTLSASKTITKRFNSLESRSQINKFPVNTSRLNLSQGVSDSEKLPKLFKEEDSSPSLKHNQLEEQQKGQVIVSQLSSKIQKNSSFQMGLLKIKQKIEHE